MSPTEIDPVFILLYPFELSSAYNYPKWMASPVAVALASPVIFYELMLRDPVGAVMLLSVVVFK